MQMNKILLFQSFIAYWTPEKYNQMMTFMHLNDPFFVYPKDSIQSDFVV